MTIPDERIEYEDRYTALGIPYPDPETMCKGQCEGTGIVPVDSDETDPDLRDAWNAAHAETCTNGVPCDGWHFVKCPTCGGTGLSTAPR